MPAAKTTDDLPFDPEKEIRGLKKLRAYAARLHPRRVARPLPPNASKLGGIILWPEDEPWPVCDKGHLDDEPPHSVAYEPLVQLRKADAVDWLFPGNTDLMQLLWCPHQHMVLEDEPSQMNPGYRLVWRREQDVRRPRSHAPQFQGPAWAHPLRECQFHPEPYWDYPHYFDLDDSTQRRVSAWLPPGSPGNQNQPDPLAGFDLSGMEGIGQEVMDFVRRAQTDGVKAYQNSIAAAPGTKFLGHPNWVQSPAWCDAQCPRGHAMNFVLQIDTDELGRDDNLRWCPLEDRQEYQNQAQLLWDGPIRCPHGVMFGDVGCLFLMVCLQCESRPARVIFQCL